MICFICSYVRYNSSALFSEFYLWTRNWRMQFIDWLEFNLTFCSFQYSGEQPPIHHLRWGGIEDNWSAHWLGLHRWIIWSVLNILWNVFRDGRRQNHNEKIKIGCKRYRIDSETKKHRDRVSGYFLDVYWVSPTYVKWMERLVCFSSSVILKKNSTR